jgi:hypothetical protein
MQRLLPSGALATVTMAIQLSALSQELDRALLAKLAASPLTVTSYCVAYRACANRTDRERQIALIGTVGRGLDQYVRARLVRHALAVMRMPARAAGWARCRGFRARRCRFRPDARATEFLDTIDARESALMNAIFAGDDAPFRDPRASTP